MLLAAWFIGCGGTCFAFLYILGYFCSLYINTRLQKERIKHPLFPYIYPGGMFGKSFMEFYAIGYSWLWLYLNIQLTDEKYIRDSSATFTLSFETNFVLGLQKMLADLIWWGFLPSLDLQYPGNSTNASVLQYHEESFIATKCYLKMRLYAPEIHVIENLIIVIIVSFIRSLFENFDARGN